MWLHFHIEQYVILGWLTSYSTYISPWIEVSLLFLWLFIILQGFTLEDATGLAIKGDVDIHSVYVTSLPNSHPSFSPNRVLELSEKWKYHSATHGHVRLFIGVLSATNHFAERMAVRKTWMQSSAIKSSEVAVRFFVALVRQILGCLLNPIWTIKRYLEHFG